MEKNIFHALYLHYFLVSAKMLLGTWGISLSRRIISLILCSQFPDTLYNSFFMQNIFVLNF